MPKTTVHGGASSVRGLRVGGGQAWDGNSSTTSSEPIEPTKSDSEQSLQSPAPTTEPLSSPGPEESSTVPSTDGSGAGDPYDDWLKEDLVAELADRDLPVSGNKPELIARLREDDAKDE